MKYFKMILLISGMVFCLQTRVSAQVKIKSSLLVNGVKTVYGSNHRIKSTLGQPVIGKTINSNYINSLGFWYLADKSGITDFRLSPSSLLPKDYSLKQNYPNPFNPVTKIQFSVPKQSFVTLSVYDILGRAIIVLLEKELLPGEYEINFNAEHLSSGIYFYQFMSSDFSKVRKMMLMR